MKIKVIFFIAINLICKNFSAAQSFSDIFIFQNEIILQENQKAIISFISDMDIDSKGTFWIIDWDSHALIKYDKFGKLPKIIASKGNGPGELIMPQDIFIDNHNHVFIASFTNRITEFDNEGNFIRSFICTDGHFPTTGIAVLSNGNILVGGRKYTTKSISEMNQRKNIYGYMIHLYSYEGKYIKSFYEMDPIVRKRNLDMYSGSKFAIDDRNQIYAVQPVNYIISVFDENGSLIRTLGKRQSYYKEPKPLTSDIKRNKKKLEEYEQNFTYMGELFIYRNYLISIAKIFGGINNDQNKYFIDFYDKNNGKTILSGIKSEKRLIRVKQDHFYFLTTDENIDTGEIKYVIEIYKIKALD